MNLDEIKRRTNPFHPYNLMVVAVSLIVVSWCWHSTGMSMGKLYEGWGNMLAYLAGNPEIKDSGFFPPDLTSGRLAKYLLSMLETVHRLLVADGHRVTFHGRNETRVMEAKEKVPDAHDAVIGDLSNISGMRQVADQANALGCYDAVIHNAGVGYENRRGQRQPMASPWSLPLTSSPRTSSRR